MEKVCGPLRPSKKHPHVWTKDELVQTAVVELHMTLTAARKLAKAELCHLLGLPSPAPVAIAAPHSVQAKKICTKKRNVPRYSRPELETMAMTQHQKTKKEVRAMSYDALCQLLKLPLVLTPPPIPAHVPSPPSGNCVVRSNKALRDHQKAVVRYLDTHRGLLVFHKVGSGKTLTAITVSQCYLDQHPTHRVLVVAPAGLLHNFRDEMTTSYVNIKHPERYEFYSYQKFTSLAKKRKTPLCTNTLVIVDEGHNLRTPFKDNKDPKKRKGINTKYVLECAEKANKVLLLTGTPLYNSYTDIFTLYNMIRDKGTPAITKAAYSNSKENNTMGMNAFQRLFCKISYHDTTGNPNFPTRIDKRHTIVMSPEYMAKYVKVLDTIKGNADVFVTNLFGNKNLTAFFNATRRAVNNLDNSASNRKLQWLVDQLTSLPRNEKSIVFSNFLEAGLRIVISKLPPSYSYAVIEGKVPMDERKQIVHDFNQGKYRVLFISKAGGEGLDMKGVRHVFLMDPTWNQASNEQVIGRAIRYQSHVLLPPDQRNVTVHSLLHIFPNDVPMVKEMDDYLAHSTNHAEPKVNPEDNSMDLFLSFFLRKKQIVLDKYIDRLKNFSIEKNAC